MEGHLLSSVSSYISIMTFVGLVDWFSFLRLGIAQADLNLLLSCLNHFHGRIPGMFLHAQMFPWSFLVCLGFCLFFLRGFRVEIQGLRP